jgi:Ca2+/Na+ antiporter
MGSALASAFIPPGSLLGCEEGEPEYEGGEPSVTCLPPSLESDWLWGMVQCLSLLVIYGYVLFNASNMLSEGSELLLLVPSLANLVGSVVLPILGAVPDGAIMLFSGLGPGAQEQLSVGVGALAGSTIMLLTIPWGLCIMTGAVGIKDGVARYGVIKKKGATLDAKDLLEAKMAGDEGLGVSPSPTISFNAKIMICTSLIYLAIQGPALPYAETPTTDAVNKELAKVESGWSLLGLVLAILAFITYLILMVVFADDDVEEVKNDKVNKVINKEVGKGQTKILTLITPMIMKWKSTVKDAKAEALLENSEQAKRFAAVLEPHFSKYDVDGDGTISTEELPLLLKDLGARDVTRAKVKDAMDKFDTDRSGDLDKKEMVAFVLKYVMSEDVVQIEEEAAAGASPALMKDIGLLTKVVSVFVPTAKVEPAPVEVEAPPEVDDEEEEEELEMPEDLEHLSPEEQQSAILSRAFGMMGLGTALILVFSDPMVDVLGNVGDRIGCPAFYISFVLAPLASNASELIASVTYAKKKTKKTITVALSALEGAACMNNTFCLAIFMGLVYFKSLAWKFTAETLAILIVQLIVGIIAMQQTMSRLTGAFILSLFPLSIAFIVYLEAIGLD